VKGVTFVEFSTLIEKNTQMAQARIQKVNETATGRNVTFRDNQTQQILTRTQVVQLIESGNLQGYHIRRINGIKTPCSNPDNTSNNNLG